MVRIGIVGIGFMGMIHYLAARALSDARVTAICSRDPKKRAGDWRGIRGNFGPVGEQMDLGDIHRHDALEKLLADPEVDLVDICVPNEQHPATVIAALEAGKHVLVEKAIALEPEQADAMLAAAEKAGKLLMVAHVLPFVPEFHFALETARSGQYGKLQAGQFKRVTARPDWSAAMADAHTTGGPAIDLHIHDTHFIGLLCGVPKAVFATGVIEQNIVRHLTTQYLYADGPSITCVSGDLCQKGREFVHGYELYFEKATLLFEAGTQPLTMLTADGQQHTPDLPGGDEATAPFTAELQVATEGVRSGKMPEWLSGKLARDALVMCHQECASVRTGQAVTLG